MSPQARSKSKEKYSTKAMKEQKTPQKMVNGNAGSGSSANAYNPVSGTFHSLETVAVSPAASPKGRYRSIDETDDHSGSSLGTTVDYDSVSNNESCSGESEDLKEKASVAPRQEPPPGSASSGNGKRDKIRQKNERKHQRQRERRAQELHDRCTGYLMSWKLEALSQQLVAMGFSSDRATMALIMNEGRVEESVAWLFEAGEEVQAAEAKVGARGNLKIDITEEVARIADMEIKFKCTKQEVERAVVACEGDLEKADELLRTQKQETKSQKPEEPTDPPSSGGTRPVAAVPLTVSKAPAIAKAGTVPLVLQRRDERDFNYAKMVSDTSNRQVVAGRRSQAKTEWARAQLPPATDRKSWPSASAGASVSYSLTTSMSGAPLASKTLQPQARGLAGGNESKTISSQTVTVREPVIVMQRPQSNNSKQHSPTHPGSASAIASWKTKNGAGIEHVPSSGPGDMVATSTSTSNAGAQQHQPSQYQPFKPSPVDAIAASWSAATSISRGYGGSADPQIPAAGGWNSQGHHQHLGVSPALGLYTGWSSSVPSGNPLTPSTADWNRGRLMMECDYTNIDWSLTPSSCISRPGQPTPGFSSLSPNSQAYEPWLGTSDSKGVGLLFGSRPQDGGVVAEGSPALHDWTSPFAGKDLFSLPRQVVTSPSL